MTYLPNTPTAPSRKSFLASGVNLSSQIESLFSTTRLMIVFSFLLPGPSTTGVASQSQEYSLLQSWVLTPNLPTTATGIEPTRPNNSLTWWTPITHGSGVAISTTLLECGLTTRSGASRLALTRLKTLTRGECIGSLESPTMNRTCWCLLPLGWPANSCLKASQRSTWSRTWLRATILRSLMNSIKWDLTTFSRVIWCWTIRLLLYLIFGMDLLRTALTHYSLA